MAYYEKVKKLRGLALTQMILGLINFVIWIIMIVVLIGVSAEANSKGTLTKTEAGGTVLSLVFLYGIVIINGIAMFIIWIITMVKAFSLENNNIIGGPTKDLTAIKVLSVLNGMTLNIGLFVAVNSEFRALQVAEETKVSTVAEPKAAQQITEKTEVKLDVKEKMKKIDDLLAKEVISKEEHAHLRAEILKEEMKK
ncbi:hypothetical protein [Mycoplasma todarodis]|uniref:Uncharacterized protein n=1 Tax=Mycoplasma todarodis TaxID=1937191 RepID=A0A4R0XUH8_9MOLU|nr:hypothetical protein [Mycoplasma todarodis]TCG11447.1 hypothetical protein C4B25_01520 [Mycoplasma todarodis]